MARALAPRASDATALARCPAAGARAGPRTPGLPSGWRAGAQVSTTLARGRLPVAAPARRHPNAPRAGAAACTRCARWPDVPVTPPRWRNALLQAAALAREHPACRWAGVWATTLARGPDASGRASATPSKRSSSWRGRMHAVCALARRASDAAALARCPAAGRRAGPRARGMSSCWRAVACRWARWRESFLQVAALARPRQNGKSG